MLTGVLSYLLAVYQIFLGHKEDDIIDAGNADTKTESPSAKDNKMGEDGQSVDPIINEGKTRNDFHPTGEFKEEKETTSTRKVGTNIGMSDIKKSLANTKGQNHDCLTENMIELDIPYLVEETEESNTYEAVKTPRRVTSKQTQQTLSTPGSSENNEIKEQQVIKPIGSEGSNMKEAKLQGQTPRGSHGYKVARTGNR